MRLGQDSHIALGDGVTSNRTCNMIAAEGTTLRIGDDVMIATRVEIRTDDAHPVFDVEGGTRVNVSKDVNIGSHVRLGNNAMTVPGTSIEDGSEVGHSSVVKG